MILGFDDQFSGLIVRDQQSYAAQNCYLPAQALNPQFPLTQVYILHPQENRNRTVRDLSFRGLAL